MPFHREAAQRLLPRQGGTAALGKSQMLTEDPLNGDRAEPQWPEANHRKPSHGRGGGGASPENKRPTSRLAKPGSLEPGHGHTPPGPSWAHTQGTGAPTRQLAQLTGCPAWRACPWHLRRTCDKASVCTRCLSPGDQEARGPVGGAQCLCSWEGPLRAPLPVGPFPSFPCKNLPAVHTHTPLLHASLPHCLGPTWTRVQTHR